jgi:hypothetical protein
MARNDIAYRASSVRTIRSCASALLLTILASFISACSDEPHFSKDRVFTIGGFSFLPPQNPGWSEKLGQNAVDYSKKTELPQVTFHTGALHGKMPAKVESNDELLKFVRLRMEKDQWEPAGRYSNIKTSYVIDDKAKSCASYDLFAHDHGASNRGSSEYLLMQSRGRFCLHPGGSASGIDLYYSVRYPQSFDPTELVLEGEAFLASLQFIERP